MEKMSTSTEQTADQIQKLADLLEQGAITKREFNSQKKKILS